MRQNDKSTHHTILALALGLILLIGLGTSPGTAYALPFDMTLEFAVFEPNDSGARLGGSFGVFYEDTSGNLTTFPLLGTSMIPKLAPGEMFQAIIRVDLTPVPDGADVLVNFDGIFNISGDMQTAFAFEAGTKEGAEAVATEPLAAPFIFLGNAGPVFATSTPRPTLPIFAFASPGVQVGTVSIVDITAVPEPGTLLLFMSGLAGLGFVRWKVRRNRSVG